MNWALAEYIFLGLQILCFSMLWRSGWLNQKWLVGVLVFMFLTIASYVLNRI